MPRCSSSSTGLSVMIDCPSYLLEAMRVCPCAMSRRRDSGPGTAGITAFLSQCQLPRMGSKDCVLLYDRIVYGGTLSETDGVPDPCLRCHRQYIGCAHWRCSCPLTI